MLVVPRKSFFLQHTSEFRVTGIGTGVTRLVVMPVDVGMDVLHASGIDRAAVQPPQCNPFIDDDEAKNHQDTEVNPNRQHALPHAMHHHSPMRIPIPVPVRQSVFRVHQQCHSGTTRHVRFQHKRLTLGEFQIVWNLKIVQLS